ncbi:MAG: alpha/beta hydrolase [Desulfobacterales bacterium]|nr:alpha/beta hydrolase [Desulfobacterales bacterium]
MKRRDDIYKGEDGEFHFIRWGGQGPLAHFSHATGLCAGLYTPLAEILRRRLRVLGMDDRGHGRTTTPADPRRLKNWDIFVKDLERFFEHLEEPVIAMGHSRGATVSMLLAAKRPDLVRALVLIDPTILPFSWMWWWFLAKKTGVGRRAPIIARAAKRKNIWPDRETILSAYRDKPMFRSWKDGFLEAYIADGVMKDAGGRIRLCCEPAWESECFHACPHDVWRFVPRLRTPVLVLYGADSDTFLSPAVKRFKAKAPGAILRSFDKTSHFVPMERPDESAEAIFTFLEDKKIL